MRCIRWLAGLAVLMAVACATQAAASASGNILQLGFRVAYRCTLHVGGMVDCVSERPYLGGWVGDAAVYRPVRMVARGATQLAVGGFASCAVVAGALDCWDALPTAGKKAVPPKRIMAAGVTDVSVGDDHACVVANGAALCWGRDFEGQVDGIPGNETQQIKPWPVIAKGVTQVAAGGDLSCAVATGALWCWGSTRLARDPHYQGTPGDAPRVRVFARGVGMVATGVHHACAIVEGALWCWGDNGHGQVGIGYSREHAQHSPNVLPWDPRGGKHFADGAQTCLSSWQDVACSVNHPVKVIDHGVTAVYASGDETCALAGGALLCWGANREAQLGVGPRRQDVPKPPAVGGWAAVPGIASARYDVLKPTLAIAGGVTYAAVTRDRICAVMRDATLRCTAPCTREHDALTCPAQPTFVVGNPTDLSGVEARVGVWRGSIGGSKVMVWLGRPADLEGSMYYYLRHRFSIELHASDNAGATWGEAPPGTRTPDWSKPAAVWALQPPVGDRMEGTWSAADGSRTAPISLTRVTAASARHGVSDNAERDNKAGLAFNAPRVASQKLSTSQAADGTRTTSALNGQVSMTEIPDALPHAAQINASTRAWFAAQIAGYYDCAFSNFDRKPDTSYSETSEIDLLAPPWLVTRESYSAFCGGAHPASGTSYTVWSLDTGKTVEPWDFIKNSHWDFINKVYHCSNASECQRMPPPDLKAILAERFKHDGAGDGDCDGALDAWPGYILHPEKDGLVFSTNFAFVSYACNDDIKLPWKTLAPFLTAQGKAAMRALQESQ